jgi:hypothetical protein
MKPSEAEIKQAIAESHRMRAAADDPHALAKTVLYLQRRVESLEKVCRTADLYLHFGMPEKEHAELVLALEEAKRIAAEESGDATENLGLG